MDAKNIDTWFAAECERTLDAASASGELYRRYLAHVGEPWRAMSHRRFVQTLCSRFGCSRSRLRGERALRGVALRPQDYI